MAGEEALLLNYVESFFLGKDCQKRSQCTTNKNGRFIERSIYQEALEEKEKRVKENPEYYKLRQQITEHLPKAFGRHSKTSMGF